jgi:hypothetical protein
MKKHKIYELIGRLTVYAIGYLLALKVSIDLLVYIVCNCCTTVR